MFVSASIALFYQSTCQALDNAVAELIYHRMEI